MCCHLAVSLFHFEGLGRQGFRFQCFVAKCFIFKGFGGHGFILNASEAKGFISKVSAAKAPFSMFWLRGREVVISLEFEVRSKIVLGKYWASIVGSTSGDLHRICSWSE